MIYDHICIVYMYEMLKDEEKLILNVSKEGTTLEKQEDQEGGDRRSQ